MNAPTTQTLYTQTNSADDNEVVLFHRSADGTLLPGNRFRTDGFGTGPALAVNSQGSVALGAGGRYLFAVNAGSNDISSFAVTVDGLRLVGKVPSAGPGPVGIAVRDTLLYVANAFGSGSIAGFTVESDGRLSALAGSQRPLSGEGAMPAQVSFTPDGRFLVVTELATDRIVTYRIGNDGLPGVPHHVPSAGQTPFGFAFDPEGRLVVSEAFGNAPEGSAVSSYRLSATGKPALISGSVPTKQTAACWLVITPDGRYAYSSNSGSGSISGYRIQPDGSLTPLDDDGRTGVTGAGSHPQDMAISDDGRHLYVLNGGSQTIGAFAVQLGGGLRPLPYAGGIPAGAVGLIIH